MAELAAICRQRSPSAAARAASLVRSHGSRRLANTLARCRHPWRCTKCLDGFEEMLHEYVSRLVREARCHASQDTTMNDDRLIDIESRIAFFADAQQQMSDVIARQEKELEGLTRRVHDLEEQLRQLVPLLNADAGNEPPPHY